MSSLLVGLLGAMVATNQPAALSNLLEQSTGIAITVPDPNDPVRQELKKIMEADDAAAAEVDEWIRENDAFAAQGGGERQRDMNRRIRQRFAPVRAAYEDLIRRHPDNAQVRVAYASFLNDLGDEDGQMEQLMKANELDPKDAAIWNNMGNYYGHNGPTEKAFECYEKALALNPKEPVYFQNFATTVYLFRPAAREYWKITEPEVFDKALGLYRRAMELAPTDFPLASDYAQSYYGIRPMRVDEALKAWTNAFNLARDQIERDGVHIHFARIKMNAGQFDEARVHLNTITNGMYETLKTRLERNLAEKIDSSKTNAPASSEPAAIP